MLNGRDVTWSRLFFFVKFSCVSPSQNFFCIFAAGLSAYSCQHFLLNKTKRYARLAVGNVRNFLDYNASECNSSALKRGLIITFSVIR